MVCNQLSHLQVGERVVVDGRLVTSKAVGTAAEFALALVKLLRGDDAEKEVRATGHFS